MTGPRVTPGTVLFVAIVLGFLADLLLWDTRWGIAFTLWVAALTVVLALLFVGAPAPAPRGWKLGLALLIMTGMAASWRDSSVLIAIDVLAAASCAAVVLVRTSKGRLLVIRFSDLARESIAGMIDALIGAPSLIAADRTAWRQRGGGSAAALPIVRGSLLAVPLLILFGALFASADATFEYILVTVLDIDLVSLFRHAVVISVVSWVLAGVLYGRFLHSHADVVRNAPSSGPTLGIIEVSLPLGAVAMLSGLFVLTQLAYLFGGGAYVLGTPAITLAEYARRGFFELIAVAALSLPLLLAADWLLRNEDKRARRIFTAISIIQLVLLAVIMASAFHRLHVYQTHFGLTESRLYAAALLVWVAAVCGIYAGSVLRGRREHFVSGSLLAGLLVLAALHGLNPDARIAQVNLSRFHQGAALDTCYLGTLSADAVPVLLGALQELPAQERAAIRSVLVDQREDLQAADWRSWNLGRGWAREMFKEINLTP